MGVFVARAASLGCLDTEASTSEEEPGDWEDEATELGTDVEKHNELGGLMTLTGISYPFKNQKSWVHNENSNFDMATDQEVFGE